MSKTFREWVLILAVCAAAGLAAFPAASMGADEVRSQVRMTVDFTVLPVVLPDGSEAPALPADPPQDSTDEAARDDASPSQAGPDAGQTAPAAASAPAAMTDPEAAQPPAAAPAPGPGPAGPGQILSVTLEETGSGARLAIATDREVEDTSYFNLDDPRRLVVDLLGQWNRKGGNVIRSEGPAVQHVVMGEHPDRFRLVIYFRNPPEGGLEPAFTRSENELFVDVPLP